MTKSSSLKLEDNPGSEIPTSNFTTKWANDNKSIAIGQPGRFETDVKVISRPEEFSWASNQTLEWHEAISPTLKNEEFLETRNPNIRIKQYTNVSLHL